MLLLGAVNRACDWMDGGMVALVCQAVTAGSYWIAKGANRDAHDGH